MAPRKKKEVLSTDNDAAVRVLKSEEFLTMPDSQAFDVALALQEIIRKQDSLLANQDTMSQDIAKLKEQQAKYDEASAKFNENRDKFVKEVLDKASKLKVTGSKKEKMIAKGSLALQEEIKNARAINASDKLKFEETIRKMPKVKYISPGKWEMGSVSGGAPQQHLLPEEVRIKHMRWVLPINQEVEIPQAVYEVLQLRRRSAQETQERQEALAKIMNNDELNAKTAEIDAKYKTNSAKPFQE